MDKLQLIEFFDSLPPETSREYELELTKLAKHTKFPQQKTETSEALKCVLSEILNGDYSDKVRYSAFFCLNIVHRYNKDFDLLGALFRDYGPQFSLHIMYNHIKAIYEIESGAIYDYDTMLNITYNDATWFNTHSGCLHLFADVVASIYEKGDLNDVDLFRNTWYDRAITAVDKAIELEPTYAKFFCTKARILYINNNFAAAEANINHAIACEDSSRSDYFIRLSTYQYYKAMINARRLIKEMENKFKSLQVVHAQNVPPPVPYDGDAPYAFVSYSHKDSGNVYEVIRSLQGKGLRLWFDKGIPPATDFVATIAEKINKCAVFLLMVSNNSINAEWVRKEYFYASTQSQIKKIVYVFLEETDLPPSAELQMGASQRIKKFELQDAEFAQLMQSTLSLIAEKEPDNA